MIVALGSTTEQHIGRLAQLRAALMTFARGARQAIEAGNFDIASSVIHTLLLTAGEWRAQLLEVGQHAIDDPINIEIDELWLDFLHRFRAAPAPLVPLQVAMNTATRPGILYSTDWNSRRRR